eukprot:g62297.t1
MSCAPLLHVARQAAEDLRVVLALDLDCFYAQVMERRDPSLVGQPVAIQQKYIVVTCNYIARSYGVSKLCGLEKARRLCPQLCVVDGSDLTPFRKASEQIYQLWLSLGCAVERCGMDECFLDVTELAKNRLPALGRVNVAADPTHFTHFAGHVFGDISSEPAEVASLLAAGSQIANEARARLREELGYTCCAGIGTGKLAAKLASEMHKPNQQTTLLPSALPHYIDDLPIRVIQGVGRALRHAIATELQGDEQASTTTTIPPSSLSLSSSSRATTAACGGAKKVRALRTPQPWQAQQMREREKEKGEKQEEGKQQQQQQEEEEEYLEHEKQEEEQEGAQREVLCRDVRRMGWARLLKAVTNNNAKARFIWLAVHGRETRPVCASQSQHKTLSQEETSLPHPRDLATATERLRLLAGRVQPMVMERYRARGELPLTLRLTIVNKLSANTQQPKKNPHTGHRGAKWLKPEARQMQVMPEVYSSPSALFRAALPLLRKVCPQNAPLVLARMNLAVTAWTSCSRLSSTTGILESMKNTSDCKRLLGDVDEAVLSELPEPLRSELNQLACYKQQQQRQSDTTACYKQKQRHSPGRPSRTIGNSKRHKHTRTAAGHGQSASKPGKSASKPSSKQVDTKFKPAGDFFKPHKKLCSAPSSSTMISITSTTKEPSQASADTSKETCINSLDEFFGLT